MLSVVAVIVVMVSLLGDLKPLYQVDGSGGNPIKNVMDQEAGVYSDLKLISIRDPQSLLEQSVAEGFDKRLSMINMRLIIRVNDDILYASPKLSRTTEWQGQLPKFGTVSDRNTEFAGNLLITRHEDFLLPDKSKASLFVVTDANSFQKVLKQYSTWLIVILLIILALTNGVLTYLVSRSIIRPLKALQRATEEIKEGNLDYEVKPLSRDEIGQLSVAFEEMRKKLKESVELQLQYEENRKELISNISHDLKTPVTAIKGYVEGIMDGVTNSPEKLDRYVKTIYTKTVHMDKMIDELFLYSKLDLGKLPFHFEQVDIGAYLEDCAQEMYPDMEKKGIKLEQGTLLEDLVFVKADREKLKRVLINILENAMKYMDKADGKIGMNVTLQDGKAVISVSDNGRGIAEDALPHIFDRFYRADPSRNQATGGSGLGLSIARQIIEEHGGQIWAGSMLGRGTTVYIALPVWSKHEREGASA
ncbi:HAMP domain-containing sensor histidine kinase [Paenibacillus sediminis]|uniref:histidine kinase n=1 Tax=Paenibacillus sediminis TaxID=664909 RepID=A0ABS4H2W0_9BACL|nr:signal transduction histidine kinase [Paenibacillus sediminis]